MTSFTSKVKSVSLNFRYLDSACDSNTSAMQMLNQISKAAKSKGYANCLFLKQHQHKHDVRTPKPDVPGSVVTLYVTPNRIPGCVLSSLI